MPCPPDAVWTLDDYVIYIGSILKEKGISKCHIVCHSFGARVAVLLINKFPHLVDKLVVVGGAGLKPRSNLKIWLKIKVYKIKKKLFGRANGGSLDYNKLTDNGKRTFNNIIGRDLSAEINNIKTPTLLIYGKNDRATPVYMAKRWAKLCETARYVIYKNAGHFAYLDNSARFIKDTAEFLCGSGTFKK
jgi:pimeloyl-ACP methyl ester carboxylesterase